ncbi:MAG: 6-phosphofructokinase [Cyclobacteriaceae bacterium]|nr:MAG: 6-phosphofructokinase [Cyclobacteriaceae bacterium]
MGKKVLVVTGGGDCPGLNAVIRAIVKRSAQEKDCEVIGSIESYNGILVDPMEVVVLNEYAVAGIHVRGGTIIGTTNKGGPFAWPVQNEDGSWSAVDRSQELLQRIQNLSIDAVISIGGDGSQKISQKLFEMGCNIIGVPKTIDNDLSATDFTFGFRTAVQIATESVDKLVTTAESHNRIMIMEVMGRQAGWIALHSAIAGGAEVCLIPEIPYDIDKVMEKINSRFSNGKGFVVIVVAEGAKPKGGTVTGTISREAGYENIRLGGVAYKLKQEIKDKGCEASSRVTVLGHLQRGGIPIAIDRLLATQFGVKAFEMVLEEDFGKMVSARHPNIVSVPLEEATKHYNFIGKDSNLLKTARGIGMCLGD